MRGVHRTSLEQWSTVGYILQINTHSPHNLTLLPTIQFQKQQLIIRSDSRGYLPVGAKLS